MKILITGGMGFIGQSLWQYFLNNKYKIDVIDKLKLSSNHFEKNSNFNYLNINLEKYENLSNLKKNYDYIFHLAAFNGTKNFYLKPVEVINANYKSTENLLRHFANSKKLKKFIFASTSEVYASTIIRGMDNIPTKEEVLISVDSIFNPRWSYASSKILSEVLINSYKIKFQNFNYLILRYHNIYGPNQKDHFISDYLERVIKSKKSVIYGNDYRSYMYIDDCIEHTIRLALNRLVKNQIINVGSDKMYQSIKVAKIINKILKVNKKIKILKGFKGSVSKRLASTHKLNKYSKYKNKYDLYQGLEKIIKR